MIKECMDHTAATEEQKKDYRSGYFLPFKINSNCYFSNVLPRFLRMFMFFFMSLHIEEEILRHFLWK